MARCTQADFEAPADLEALRTLGPEEYGLLIWPFKRVLGVDPRQVQSWALRVGAPNLAF